MNRIRSWKRQLTMLDFKPVGESEVACCHHCLDRSRSAFALSLGELFEATASSFAAAFAFFEAGNIAAALSSSSMTMQPLEVERQRIRPIKSRRCILLLIAQHENRLELRVQCRPSADPLPSRAASEAPSSRLEPCAVVHEGPFPPGRYRSSRRRARMPSATNQTGP